VIPLGSRDDEGTALPTTLMLWADRNVTTLEGLLQIRGGSNTSSSLIQFDHNLCVTGGFACGVNVVLPPHGCFIEMPGAQGWSFFDSHLCYGAFSNERRVLVALYRVACASNRTIDCADGQHMGFFEAVDADATGAPTRDEFARIVLANNAGREAGWISSGKELKGNYVTFAGQAIEFSTAAHQSNPELTGVGARAALSRWPRAEGPMTYGTDRVQYRLPGTSRGFDIELGNGWPQRSDYEF
jgi:hypothetical protein